MSSDCIICCLPSNKTSHAPITCQFCKFICCKKCVRDYIMLRPEEAHCMSCKASWPLDFMFLNFPKTFINGEYDTKLAKMKLEQQKTLLPETQHNLTWRIYRKQLRRLAETFDNNARLYHAVIEHARSSRSLNPMDMNLKIKNLTDTLQLSKEKYRELYDFLNPPSSSESDYLSSSELEDTQKKKRETFLCQCPVETCRGFVSSRGKCGMCMSKVCTKCHIQLSDDIEHECQPEDLATASLIKSDCKHCPHCKTLIQRIDGCSQMFCTNCHTGFDWNTGEILKKLHNPHLTEWLISQNKDPNGQDTRANHCGVRPYLAKLIDKVPGSDRSLVRAVWDKAQHFHHYEIPILNNTDKFDDEFLRMREKYLEKRLEIDDWVQQIKILQKKMLRNKEVRDVLELYHDATMDLLLHFYQQSGHDFDLTRKGLESVSTMANDKLKVIEKRLNISLGKYMV